MGGPGQVFQQRFKGVFMAKAIASRCLPRGMAQAFRFWVWVVCGCWVGGLAHADSLQTLSVFLKQTQSMRADFVQTVTTPAKENRPIKRKLSSGQFAFLRPSVFRFDYLKPSVQNIVADGQHLWFYDSDLQQVTQRNQTQALSATPAALIATATDVSALAKDFNLQAQPDAQGLQWVSASPKSTDHSLQSIRMGLKQQGDQVWLAQLDILDAFGTRSQIVFDRIDINPRQVTLAQFSFTPPKGVEVIKP